MIRCNLAILLAERNLKITKVSKDTGVSRTTLTSLSNNYSQGIQFDTINTLCNYLKVTPEQLISYIPIDIKLTLNSFNKDSTDLLTVVADLLISEKSKNYLCSMPINCFITYNDTKIDFIEISIELFVEDDKETQNENSIIINSIKMLPITFLNDIENEISHEVFSYLEEEKEFSDDFAFCVTWSDEFKL
ncbi:helix-turn-helix transcriptional regulator [Clostridium perfringens]|uniref:helix-turn-helix domain-containing protein n=1 Tax=Clostridium perfringens TaxID=1502 RepID=UPI0018E42E43|nr:helix-turn-helix transcriptional regulator [Clostridium perfringens]MBI6029284.1 helix-turn-helix transcriptional regulator [Clostridium perfringens]MBI6033650.1 helix-turn-helix transcriptional regulator [Clostridium perfringens]MDK0667688.1 helix-turn-helix transcriptional regulator [Clostridium perfringens]